MYSGCTVVLAVKLAFFCFSVCLQVTILQFRNTCQADKSQILLDMHFNYISYTLLTTSSTLSDVRFTPWKVTICFYSLTCFDICFFPFLLFENVQKCFVLLLRMNVCWVLEIHDMHAF